jgi:hypothetical protein
MYEVENHITEAIEIVLSSDLDDQFLSGAITAQAKLNACAPVDDYWCLNSDASLH